MTARQPFSIKLERNLIERLRSSLLFNLELLRDALRQPYFVTRFVNAPMSSKKFPCAGSITV